MTETLLHASDSLAAIEGGPDGESPDLGGLTAVVDRAIERNVDAVVHTGNLFRKPDPADETVAAVRETLADLAAANATFFVVPGRREVHGERNTLDRIRDADGVVELTESPVVTGEVALFGVGHVDTRATLEERLAALEPTDSFAYNVVCVHQRIWPPLQEYTADVSSYDFLDATDVYVDAVLAGGHETHRTWESDDYDYLVTYAGSTNPESLDAGETAGATLIEAGTDEQSFERIALTPSGIGDELAQLRDALEFQPADIGDADAETLADLYGLAATVKSVYESRRKELRDALQERVDEDGTVEGEYASVNRTTQRRRNLRDESEVFAILDDAGVDRDEVMALDSSAVRKLSEAGVVDEDAVFDVEERSYVRVNDTKL